MDNLLRDVRAVSTRWGESRTTTDQSLLSRAARRIGKAIQSASPGFRRRGGGRIVYDAAAWM
jgi:hypothetical protein